MSNIQVYPDGRLVFGGNTYRCAIGRLGVTSRKAEADGATPAGCYPLRKVYYRADKMRKPKTKLETVIINKDDGWCDDPTCPDYNQFVKLPHPGSHERLWRDDDNLYDIVMPIGYNDDPPVPGKGSAIFVHIARPSFTPTNGCVALAEGDLLEILAQITPDTKICIYGA